VIGVALFRARHVAPPPPPAASAAPAPREYDKREMHEPLRDRAMNESAPAPSMARPSAPIGTGHGRREDSPIRWVQFERATSEPAETVAVYYDSYRNLVARGILQQPVGRRDPNPFPTAFAPDPWR
jgi:hypothetical protein